MHFYIMAEGQQFPQTNQETYIFFRSAPGNDFGYRTTLRAFLRINYRTYILGWIKIACNDDIKLKILKDNHYASENSSTSVFSDYTKLIPQEFEQLPKGFYSLGAQNFYENLRDFNEHKIDKNNILQSLNDLAFTPQLIDKYIDLPERSPVIDMSILRNTSIDEIKHQLNRIAHGGVTLDNYQINLPTLSTDETKYISFTVAPFSTPPSNVHAIIGSNGSGKSYLLSQIVDLYLNDRKHNRPEFTNILNLICISFSPFDRILQGKAIQGQNIEYIGLRDHPTSKKCVTYKNQSLLDQQFITHTLECSKSILKRALWKKVIQVLETDYFFKSINLSEWHKKYWYKQHLTKPHEIEQELTQFFHTLGSGHRIILLTLTILINCLKEKTLVLYDEPETYLHPPLLSALMRSISLLAEERNGIVIVTTHSPIVLQEISKNCTWKIQRFGNITNFSRPNIETFGENSSILNKEAFTLETEQAGFIQYIEKIANEVIKNNPNSDLQKAFQEGLDKFNSQLGSEGRIILLSKLKQKLEQA